MLCLKPQKSHKNIRKNTWEKKMGYITDAQLFQYVDYMIHTYISLSEI